MKNRALGRLTESNQCDDFLLHHSLIFLNVKITHPLLKTHRNPLHFVAGHKTFLALRLKTLGGKMHAFCQTSLSPSHLWAYFTSNYSRRRSAFLVKSCSKF